MGGNWNELEGGLPSFSENVKNHKTSRHRSDSSLKDGVAQ